MGSSGAARGTVLGLILWLVAAVSSAAAAVCDPGQVELRTPAGSSVRFSVELALTPAEQARGLMFRESMARSAGMLFVYPRPQRASFWMRNTLIPLDMIFAGADGTVSHVHANARPRDETPIFGGDAVLAVLEINGGLAARLGIVPGSVMRHPAFGEAAVWPCAAE
ncbi:MAG TPA: DUF192 domain-containing protein [Paracoccaceae bacterium]|nr:DUF192 domain-containing protein [Paracoccaceae bacterium]HMO73299.1 DUF192 domain-containing protein [Paracoccaceae bacterium]